MTTKSVRPTVLVLEALSGAAEMVRLAGGNARSVYPKRHAAMDVWTKGKSLPHALLLTGGGDIAPRHYGQRTSRFVYGVDQVRDLVEFDALDWAVNLGLPVMGICRGAQVMNVHAGGTLVQDLPTRLGRSAGQPHRNGTLPVHVRNHTLLAEALHELDPRVLHLHHQAIDKVGRGYRVSARHADRTVEAIEGTEGIWRIGTQFHPEHASMDDPEFGLFRQLVVQAALVAGLPVPSVRQPRPVAKPKPRPVAKPSKVVANYSSDYGKRFPITTAWRCFRCTNLVFDARLDFVDHMFFVHDVELVDHPRVPLEEIPNDVPTFEGGGSLPV